MYLFAINLPEYWAPSFVLVCDWSCWIVLMHDYTLPPSINDVQSHDPLWLCVFLLSNFSTWPYGVRGIPWLDSTQLTVAKRKQSRRNVSITDWMKDFQDLKTKDNFLHYFHLASHNLSDRQLWDDQHYPWKWQRKREVGKVSFGRKLLLWDENTQDVW